MARLKQEACGQALPAKASGRKKKCRAESDRCKPAGAIVLCRALKQRGMHTFRGMVGYCLKDRDVPHFQRVEHKISADDINDGIELHSLYGADALKNNVCLTPANVFDRTLMFRRFKLNHPSGNGFLDTLRRMISSGKYYPSSHWIIPYQGRGMPDMAEEVQTTDVDTTAADQEMLTLDDHCPFANLHDIL
ncbi:hypothetical protein L7F22_038232 [Adiantum nelumboides]|nr:hypothetical protein [Adiantum nelumboides]